VIWEGVRQGSPGLCETYTAILVVVQGWGEAVSNSTHDSGGMHYDSNDVGHQAGDWHSWLGSSEALGSSV
jgi:hypothetical protein